jgi:hypothetical protein
MNFYHPEMGETQRNDTQIEAQLGHYGKHWYIKTPLTLKGRGITFRGTLTAEDLVASASRKIGWHEYVVTERAMEKLQAMYVVSSAMLL